MESSGDRPALGRQIALDLRPAQPLTWIGPAWATVCGAIASGGLGFSGDTLVRILVAVILADPVLGAWRLAWVKTNWRAPLSIWRPTPTRSWTLLPYARLDSPAARLSRWISNRGKFWRSALWPELGQPLSTLVVSGLIALTIALVLGPTNFQLRPTPFFITIAAMALGPIEAELGAEGAGKWARALAEVTLAWLIGHSTFAELTWESGLLALFFAFTYRGLLSLPTARNYACVIANLSQLVVAGVLAARGAIVNAGLVGIGLIAQLLWQAATRGGEGGESAYLQRIQWFMLAAMLVAAAGVPH